MFLMQIKTGKFCEKKSDFDNTVSSLDSKIAENKTKNKSIENELKNLKTFYSSYFISKNYFEEDGVQNYLVFQPIRRYFKIKWIFWFWYWI